MEGIYLKCMSNEWHSEKIHLNSYFTAYSDKYLSVMKNNKVSLSKIVSSILPESNVNPNEMRKIVKNIGDMEKELELDLTNYAIIKMGKSHLNKPPMVVSKKRNLKGVPSRTSCKNSKKNIYFADVSLSEYSKTTTNKEPENPNIAEGASTLLKATPLDIFSFDGLPKTSKYKDSVLTTRSELLLNEVRSSRKRKDLKKGNNFVVSFRIHEPFFNYEDAKIENFQQEILVLSHQTLDQLRDKIICQSDFQDCRGDVSDNPDGLVKELSRDLYKSSMFYIDNTFYIDLRGNVDYSVVIKEWARPRNIDVGQTKSMTDAAVGDLQLRFGYPYLYLHQGCCEHLVIISDARLLTGKDSLHSSDYPLMTRIPRPITQYCFMCLNSPSQWIVTESKRLPHDITYMCKKCYKMFNYVNGRKCENFKAYRFFQKNVLL